MIQSLQTSATHVSPRRLLVDGARLSGILSLMIGLSARYNPEMWLHDYPPDIQAKFGPMSAKARRQRTVIAVPVLVSIFGGLLRSTQKLNAEHGGKLPFGTAFLHTFLLFHFFALYDTLVLDWLFFNTIQPPWVILPGTEGMAGYKDYGFHIRVTYLSPMPWLLSIVIALVIALIVTRLPTNQRS
jgi:hypothetical protein